MKNACFLISAFGFLFLRSAELAALQKDSVFSGNSSLTVNIGLLAFKEINASYESFLFKGYPTLSLMWTLGYKSSDRIESFQNLAETNFWADLFAYFWSNSIYGSVSVIKYLGQKPAQPYIEFAPFYRVNYFRKKIIHYDEGSDDGFINIDRLQNSTQHIFGLKFIFGFKPYFFNRFASDCYVGLGGRYKSVNKITLGESRKGVRPPQPGDHDYISYLPPKEEKLHYILPTLHFGFRVGIGWNKKKK